MDPKAMRITALKMELPFNYKKNFGLKFGVTYFEE